MAARVPAQNVQHLVLGTISFTVCFAAWGLISAFAPYFRQTFKLSATQTALLVAVPVLLGALARIPMGMLTDRFGGRAMFALLMLAVAAPVFLVPAAGSYQELLTVAFFLGMAGSSFAVGVTYRGGPQHYPLERYPQGAGAVRDRGEHRRLRSHGPFDRFAAAGSIPRTEP